MGVAAPGGAAEGDAGARGARRAEITLQGLIEEAAELQKRAAELGQVSAGVADKPTFLARILRESVLFREESLPKIAPPARC